MRVGAPITQNIPQSPADEQEASGEYSTTMIEHGSTCLANEQKAPGDNGTTVTEQITTLVAYEQEGSSEYNTSTLE